MRGAGGLGRVGLEGREGDGEARARAEAEATALYCIVCERSVGWVIGRACVGWVGVRACVQSCGVSSWRTVQCSTVQDIHTHNIAV